jgi:hypothetical protein
MSGLNPEVAIVMGSDSDWPIMSCNPFTFLFKVIVSDTKELFSIAFLIVISRRFKSGGFEIKSKAPFFTASTALSKVPCPEIMIIGTSIFSFNNCASSNRYSAALWLIKVRSSRIASP